MTSPRGRVPAIEPDVLVRQIGVLGADLRQLAPPLAEQARACAAAGGWGAVRHVALVGAGDSHHAACAAEFAFERLARVACEASSTGQFVAYGAPALDFRSAPVLVVAASASGRTPSVVEAIRQARAHGALTIAVSCRRDSPAAESAAGVVAAELRGLERSPGIRTFQATLLSLLTIAIALGEAGSVLDGEVAAALRAELAELGDAIDTTAAGLAERCRDVAAEIANARVVAVLGSGPSLGTARFAAAKLIESAGIPAIAQDLEEWWHVERHALPEDMPVFVLAPPGRSHVCATDVAAAARSLGRRVFAVADAADRELREHSDLFLPVVGMTREELSPLLYHVFASYVASFVAELSGRRPFDRVPPDGPTRLDEVRRSSAGGAAADEALLAAVVDIVTRGAHSAQPVPVGPDEALAELGYDSLDLVRLTLTLEEAFSCTFPADLLQSETFRNARTIAAALAAVRNGEAR